MKMPILTAAAAVLAMAALNCPAGPPSKPHQPKFHGKALSEWLSLYTQWLYGRGDDHVGKVQFLPIPGDPDGPTGSNTPADPLVFSGTSDVTLKAGQPFVLPAAIWAGELYGAGDPIDPEVAEAEMKLTAVLITIDGKVAYQKQPGELGPNYVKPIYFPPVMYEAPSSYGSIGAAYVQGYCYTYEPLSVGQHVLKLHSTLRLEDYNPGGLPDVNPNYDGNVNYENTWNITVTPHSGRDCDDDDDDGHGGHGRK